MTIIVLNTGTELLLGDVLNSHLSFIAREIFPLGLRVDRQVAVPDGPAIRAALEESLEQADIIFVTGGLGPTTDDITREITAELLGLELHRDAAVLAAITTRAANRGFRLTDRTARQADVPEGATVLPNETGSAPGLYLAARTAPAKKWPHLFLLPGPPRELQPMFRNSVLPILREIVPQAIRRAIAEFIASREWANRSSKRPLGSVCWKFPESSLVIAPGRERSICGSLANHRRLIERKPSSRRGWAPSVFSSDGRSLEEVVVKLLTERKQTLAVAESCTGGFLAHRITNVPGASAVFLAGYVTYSNEAKAAMLGIDPQLISEHGAVSEEVAQAMAEGARRKSECDFRFGHHWHRRAGRWHRSETSRDGFPRPGYRRAANESREAFFPRRPADF